MDLATRVLELESENSALQRTVDALIKRMDGLLDSASNQFDTFSKSVTLQQIVGRRTQELARITEDARNEAARRRKAEELMRSERRLLSSVLLHIPHLISWKDLSGAYLGCNRSFAQAVGLSDPEAIKGLHDQNLDWQPAQPELSFQREHDVLFARLPITDSEEAFVSVDGHVHTYLVSTVPMHNGESQLTGVLSIYADITDRKNLESQLLHAQKLESIGQLAAGIAHEINTPAQYVSDNIRFILDEFHDIMRILKLFESLLCASSPERSWEDRQAEMKLALDAADYNYLINEIPCALEQSVEGIGRIAHIVKAMKDFSHPGSGVKERADLNQAIESTATVCSNRWKVVSDLVLDLDPQLPNVPCLISEINQAILNIIVNAADAIESRYKQTGTKGTITITTRQVDDHVVAEFTDNGGGIPQSIRHKIFDPFFTTKDVGKGTGQGLAISRDVIVQKHGGSLDCSVNEGESTTFRISLPLNADMRHSRVA